MTKNFDISIVIPAYNEEKNFNKGKIKEAFDFLDKQKFNYEVIFVNDGSTDNTLFLLKEFCSKRNDATVVSIPHGGKMAAVKKGFILSQGQIVLFTDFDQSTPLSELSKVFKAFEEGADIVIANRKKTYHWPLPQRVRSRIFNFLVRLVVLPGIKDTQCGFKAFKNSVGKKLFKKLKVTNQRRKGRYMGAFDVELLFLAKKMGFRIKNIDVKWYCVKAGRVAFAEPIKMFLDILKIRFFDFFNKYPAT